MTTDACYFSFKGYRKQFLKVALQILGQKFYRNTKKSSLYSQSLLIFIPKTPVVESHPTTRESDIYYSQGRHRRETRSIFT